MKTLALLKRHPDLTRRTFRDHYEEVHAPLAIETVLKGTTRYVRHHLRDTLFGDEPGFDVITAFWYRDARAALAVQQRLQTPAGAAILADEETFMDRPANRFFAVSEHPVQGAELPDATLRAWALVAAADGAEAGAFTADYEAKWLPRLPEALEAPGFLLQHRALAIGPERPLWDAATQLQAAAPGALADWARDLAASGARVLVVSAEECESEL